MNGKSVLTYSNLHELVSKLSNNEIPSDWLIYEGSILGYRILKSTEDGSWYLRGVELSELPSSIGFNNNAY